MLARLNRLEDALLKRGSDEPGTGNSEYPADFITSTSEAGQHAGASDAGRLEMSQGRSCYVNSFSWLNFVDIYSFALAPRSATPGDRPSCTGFIKSAVLTRALHPIPTHLSVYWQIFKQRVDPLLKILHIPSCETEISEAMRHLGDVSSSFQCLLFAIYYASAISLSAQECLDCFGEGRAELLEKYAAALRHMFTEVDLLATHEIMVLQALVIFLTCLPSHEMRRSDATLVCVGLSIAQSIGIHRGGTTLGLSVFDTELRRRLWWQLRLQNVRAGVEHGCGFPISPAFHDNNLPLNVDDALLMRGMESIPAASSGRTDMTLCLMRIEIWRSLEDHLFASPTNSSNFQSANLAHASSMLRTKQRIEDQYLRHCGDSDPLSKFTVAVGRLMINKVSLMSYCHLHQAWNKPDWRTVLSDQLFQAALGTIDYANLIRSESWAVEWAWHCQSYSQCHAIAYVLGELGKSRQTPSMDQSNKSRDDRAWMAVKTYMAGRFSDDEIQRAPALQALLHLFHQASEDRNDAENMPLELDRSQTSESHTTFSPTSLEPSTAPPSSFLQSEPDLVRLLEDNPYEQFSWPDLEELSFH